MAKKKGQLSDAFSKHKGALHKQLGVPEDESIPMAKMMKAAQAGGKMGMRARAALNMMRAKGKGKSKSKGKGKY